MRHHTSAIQDTLRINGLIADRLFACGIIKNGVVEFGNTRRVLPIMEMAADPADSHALWLFTLL